MVQDEIQCDGEIKKNRPTTHVGVLVLGGGQRNYGNLCGVSMCWNWVAVKEIMTVCKRSRCAGIFLV